MAQRPIATGDVAQEYFMFIVAALFVLIAAAVPLVFSLLGLRRRP